MIDIELRPAAAIGSRALREQYTHALHAATVADLGEAVRQLNALHQQLRSRAASPAVCELLACIAEHFELEWRGRQSAASTR